MFDRAISSLEFCFNIYCQEYHEVLVEAKKLHLVLLFRSMVVLQKLLKSLTKKLEKRRQYKSKKNFFWKLFFEHSC